MTLDTALNLVWLALGVSALFRLAILELRCHRRSTRRARFQRLLVVLIVTLALFPAVSSSDDLFSFSLINSHLGKHDGMGTTPPEDGKERASLQLLRLLEALDHYQISGLYTLSFILSCLSFVTALPRYLVSRDVVCRSGRSPPAI